MSGFVFAHGAYHSGWHFSLLVRRLAALGYRASAPDLPCDRAGSSASIYADILADQIERQDDPVILVGHSLAGLCVPLVTQRTAKVERLVFLAALVPDVGKGLDDQGRENPALFSDYQPSASPVGNEDGSATATPEWAREVFYHDAEPDLADDASRHLRRQYWTHTQEIFPLAEWPAVPMSSIVCTEDRAVNPVWSRRIARDRLGIRPIEFVSGHSPFLSHTDQLADLLVQLAEHDQ